MLVYSRFTIEMVVRTPVTKITDKDIEALKNYSEFPFDGVNLAEYIKEALKKLDEGVLADPPLILDTLYDNLFDTNSENEEVIFNKETKELILESDNGIVLNIIEGSL
jgi:hypothetical protein